MTVKSIFINGGWHAARAGLERDIINPASGDVIARVSYGGTADALKAVAAGGEL